jgi:hypothetical protein
VAELTLLSCSAPKRLLGSTKVRAEKHFREAQDGYLWHAPAKHQKTAKMMILTGQREGNLLCKINVVRAPGLEPGTR